MNEINYKDVVNTAKSEIGYQGESKNSKFTKYLDDRQWYNYPKANACTWCAIFYDYCVAVNKGNLTDEQARQIVCEPADHKANSGAGCTQKAQMYKDHNRWISSVSKATTGDQVFFKKSNGQIYHTGILIDWDNNGIYTVEGSTDGGKVSKRYYAYNDSKLAGFGRPDWYKYQVAESTTPTIPAENKEQLYIDLAWDCYRGKYGNGLDRKRKINSLGYGNIYDKVQSYVNMICRGQLKK